jgi:hypothetical protein
MSREVRSGLRKIGFFEKLLTLSAPDGWSRALLPGQIDAASYRYRAALGSPDVEAGETEK